MENRKTSKLNFENALEKVENDVKEKQNEQVKQGFKDNTQVKFQQSDVAGVEKTSDIEAAKKEWKEKGVESKYFKKWFGDSKVVDENGKPLAVYHGSKIANIKEFDSNKTNYGHISHGFTFFTNNKNGHGESAEFYAGENGEIYKCYISMKKPLVYDATGWKDEDVEYKTPVEFFDRNAGEIKRTYRKGDYDGIIVKVGNDCIYAVPNSEQIKSVDNQGTFDETNPNIYYQGANNDNQNVVDLTNDFDKTPTLQEVKEYINEIVEKGTKFATLSPEWFIDIKKEDSNKKQKRITNKILNNGNFLKLDKPATKRHYKYVMSLEKLLANAEYLNQKENIKPDKKPNVAMYHYFKTDVKIGDKIYQVIFDTEEYKNEISSAGNYDKSRSLNPPLEDTNSITDNKENLNPKTVHLYNISEKKKGNIFFQSGYHGSAKDFDNFDLSYALSGEGAMAHGYGVYTAKNREVSEEYRKKLIPYNFDNIGMQITVNQGIKDVIYTKKATNTYGFSEDGVFEKRPDDYLNTALLYIEKTNNDKEKAIKQVQGKIDDYRENGDISNARFYLEVKEILQSYDFDITHNPDGMGQLYEVDIPEDDVLLDEDKELIEQPEKVQRIIEKIYHDASINNNDKLATAVIQIDGKGVYNGLKNYFGSAIEASLFLNEYGIKGIKYDGYRDGECYVIFDDKAVEIIQKFYQEEYGDDSNIADTNHRASIEFKDDETIISLAKSSDASSVMHEFAHLYLHDLKELAKVNKRAEEQCFNTDNIKTI